MLALKTFRRLWMGLSTLLGIKTLGYFIPYRYTETVSHYEDRDPYQEIESIFDNSRSLFIEQISYISQYTDELRHIGPAHPPQPRWNQSWFPPLDAAIAYTFVRQHAPKNFIEVGSGHSIRFMARAASDGLLDTKLVAIDPTPCASLDGLKFYD